MKNTFLKNKFSRFAFRLFRYDSIGDMIMRNHGQALVGIILRLWPTMGGALSKGRVRDVSTSLARFSSIAHSQGLKGLVKYLKQCTVLLQQALSQHSGIAPANPRVSRTKTGIPRVFPVGLRKFIQARQLNSIRLAMTLASLYRDLSYPGDINLLSITKPSTADSTVIKEIISLIPRFFRLFVSPALPKGSSLRDWLQGKFLYFPITTSSPQAYGKISSHPDVLIRSALALDPSQVKSINIINKLYQFEAGILSPGENIQMIKTTFARPASGIALPTEDMLKHTFVGKLGIKQEAAGKMRVFAMIDPWSQWTLAPLHKGIFRILSKYPNIDGTFDQLRPLRRSKGFKSLFSMDLSSATDRLPIAIQTPLIKTLFGLTVEEANSWQSLLVDRDYLVPGNKEVVRYSTGQPMGGLSSWPMLAITHHLIVQCAAWTSGVTSINKLFLDYAVLGDDIVIYNSTVARRYHVLIVALGVECNLAKSILSPKGLGMEFAKRFFVDGSDASPRPLKELYSALMGPNQLIEYMKKYNLTYTQIARVAGYGYKVVGAMNKPFTKLNTKMKYVVFGDILQNPDKLPMIFKTTMRIFQERVHVTFLNDLTWDYALRLSSNYTRIVECVTPAATSMFNTLLTGMFGAPNSIANLTKVEITAINTVALNNLRSYLSALVLNTSTKRILSSYRKGLQELSSLFTLHEAVSDVTGFNLGFGFAITIKEQLSSAMKKLSLMAMIETRTSEISPSLLEMKRSLVSKRPGDPKIHRLAVAWNKLITRKDYFELMKSSHMFKSNQRQKGFGLVLVVGIITFFLNITTGFLLGFFMSDYYYLLFKRYSRIYSSIITLINVYIGYNIITITFPGIG